MKKNALTLLLVGISFGLFSQDFEVPKDITLDKAEDFALYEQDAMKCIDWLMNTPINEQEDKREEACSFMLNWLSGTPTVRVEMDSRIVTFMGSPDLFMIFMCGWAKYSIESKDIKNKAANSLAGIEAVIEFYTKNISNMPQDKNVEKYIKMKEKETLKEFIEKNI